MKYGFLVGIAVVSLLTACGVTEPECWDICSVWAEVRGSVRLESGAPVPDAQIALAQMWENRTDSGDLVCRREDDMPTRTITGEDGKYTSKVHSLSLLPSVCIEITVTPPAGVNAAVEVDTVRVVGWSLREKAAPVTEASIVLPQGSP